MQLSIWSYRGHRFVAITRCVLPRPRTSIVRGNCVHETSVKRRNKVVQRNNAKCSKCFQFLCNNSNQTWFFNALTFTMSHGRCWKNLAFGLGFQHLPQDLANVDAWKTMFDPHIELERSYLYSQFRIFNLNTRLPDLFRGYFLLVLQKKKKRQTLITT